ncbi:hypothetical protein BGY98DRAFT_270657 [Russula aff. rugulosa BPL654]|nr:hypothetical protein BGY98DRAFT_270657 [Russula aff. rugulosa BPL654]
MLAPRSINVEPATLMNFWLVVCGIYIWEYLKNLDYEWSVVQGHQRYRWTIWIYSFSRLSGLMVVILTMADFIITSKINCQAYITAGWFIGALGAYGLASILIILRIFAIWNKNKVIMAISATIWLANAGFQFSGVVRVRSVWMPAARACLTTNPQLVRDLSIGTLATDVSLLLIMLVGLIRLRHRDRTFVDFEYVLWKQGIMWLIIATIAEVPQAVFQFLNANDTFKTLFTIPSLLIMVFAATQTYRDLTFYGSTTTKMTTGPVADSSNFPKNNRVVSSTKKSSVVHIPSNGLEETVQKAHEEFPLSQMNRCGSIPAEIHS